MMYKRIWALILALAMVAGLVPTVDALPVKVEPSSVDRCCHTLRVNPLSPNYVRPAYDGKLIEITPQRVEDHFHYLDEVYIDKHPEAALVVNTGDHRDQEVLKTLAETITAGCKTNTEKANAIDRWLYRNIYYDVNTSAYAYDTFYNRTGNCLSYANLMQFLLRSLGIPAVVGDGWRGDMKTSTVDLFNYEGHAWCFVYLEGEWVLYDPLWIECGTTDRDYIAEWIYLDTVEFITPASDGDNLPPEAWDKPKVYYTDGRWYNFDNSHPNGYGNFTMMVNNQSYNFTPCQDELALGLEGGYDGWYILDGKNDKSGMQLGEIYRNSWLSYGEYEGGGYLNLTYAHPNGMQIDGAIMEYDGVERYMQCNTSFPVLAEEEDYTIQYGCMAFKPGYVGPFVAPSWGSAYDTDFHVVTWESDTPEVCTVDQSGILTAVAPGFAQIRLTLSDQEGGGYYTITHINVCVSDEERIPQLDSPTASGVCGEDLTWVLDQNGVLTISGTGDMYDYEYMEAPWRDYLANIVQIVAEDGVTRIGNNAFREAVNLTAVSLSDTITEIGSWAFMYAENLTAITLPSNLASLEQQAFLNCCALQEIELPGTLSFIDSGVFSGCTSLTRAVIHADPDAPSLMMGDGVFRSCTSLEAIEVDEDHFCLKSIDGVLYNYSDEGLILMQYPCAKGDTVFQIPEGTYDIFQLAMEDVDALEEVIIPDGVQNIGSYAFQNCDNLRTLRFQGDAPEFGQDVVMGMTVTVYYPADNETWTEEVMQNHGGTITWVSYEKTDTSGMCGENLTWELNDSGTLTISGTGAMYDYAAGAAPWYDQRDQIINVVVSEGVTTIGEYAFYDLSNVGKTAVAPASVSANAISGNGFHLPETLQAIGEGAFSGCSGVTVVEFPAAVESIGDDAFSGCTALKEIVFQGDAPEIGETAFEDVQAKVTYPEDNETWTEEVKENYGGNITWGEEKVYSITWVEAYASLGGNIAVVFKADLSEDLVADPNAFMRFTYAGKTVDVPVSEASRAGNYYNFFCRITSVNMTDDITAQMMVGEEAIGRSVTTSLEKYCSYIISTSKDAKTVNLMKAMLNYGAAAQKMMNYKPDNLANKSLSDADKVLTKVDATQYKHSITGTEDGIKPVEALLVLGSETTIRVGFSLTGNKTIDQYTFTVDGVEVEPVLKGGKYVLEVPNIAAHRLDEYHTFTCGGITVTYCGLSYVNQVMGYYTEGTTFDMAAALYNYSQATEAYTN